MKAHFGLGELVGLVWGVRRCRQKRVGMIARERVPDRVAAVVAKRLERYDAQTVPVIQHYEKRRPVHRVDGYRDVNEVFAEIEQYLSGASQ